MSIRIIFLTLLSVNVYAASMVDAFSDYNQKRYETAFVKFISLAKEGNVNAQEQIAHMYFFGLGVEPDYKKSAKWREVASRKGYAESMYQLAGMYLSGFGVKKDEKLAIKWLESAATQGHVKSIILLGSIYKNGVGAQMIDKCKAVGWYKKAADMGDPTGLFMLNKIIFSSNGIQCR